MEFGFTLNENENDITAGIGRNIIELITKAIEANSIESFHKLDGFCNRILIMSIENKQLYHFKEYLDIVIGYYIISYEYKSKNEALYHRVHCDCADLSARRIKELFPLLNIVFNKSDLENKKLYNHFKLLAFTALSQLLFEQVKRKDKKWFEHTINQIESVFIGETIEMSEFIFFQRNISKIDELKLSDFVENIQAKIYAKHTILGIRYWLYYLYEKSQIPIEDLDEFIELSGRFKRNILSVNLWEMELLFNRLNSSQLNWYFNWQNWDYETHPEGEFYAMPNVFDWFFTGYVIDVIRYGKINMTSNLDINIIEKDIDPQSRSLFIGTLKEKIKKIITQKDLWSHLISDDFEHRVYTIEEQLKLFSSFIEIQKARTIASQKLNDSRINEFKQIFYDRWSRSKFIRRLFEFFGQRIKYDGVSGKLRLVGQNIFFNKAKVLFLGDNYYQRIYGVEDLGTQLSHWEDDFFFQTVIRGQTEIVYSSITDGLEKAIETIKFRKNTPSVIFVDSIFGWMGLKSNKKWSDEKKIEFSNGSFDSIPVFFVNANLLENRFIVADFAKAFTMLYREVENGFENELRINIKEVTDEIAKEKLNKESKSWKYIEGQEISDEDALTYIKTSVIVHFEVIELFEINDDNAFEVGLIDNTNE